MKKILLLAFSIITAGFMGAMIGEYATRLMSKIEEGEKAQVVYIHVPKTDVPSSEV